MTRGKLLSSYCLASRRRLRGPRASFRPSIPSVRRRRETTRVSPAAREHGDAVIGEIQHRDLPAFTGGVAVLEECNAGAVARYARKTEWSGAFRGVRLDLDPRVPVPPIPPGDRTTAIWLPMDSSRLTSFCPNSRGVLLPIGATASAPHSERLPMTEPPVHRNGDSFGSGCAGFRCLRKA